MANMASYQHDNDAGYKAANGLASRQRAHLRPATVCGIRELPSQLYTCIPSPSLPSHPYPSLLPQPLLFLCHRGLVHTLVMTVCLLLSTACHQLVGKYSKSPGLRSACLHYAGMSSAMWSSGRALGLSFSSPDPRHLLSSSNVGGFAV